MTECETCQKRQQRWHRWRDRALAELEDGAWIMTGYILGEIIARVLYDRHDRCIDSR